MAKSDPAWLKSMKKEADKLGIPLRELLTRSTKPAKKPKAKAKTMAAARGGAMMKKKGMAKGGMKKKGMAKGGMKKKGYSRGGATKRVMKKK
jgi:hypothetical protein